MSNRDEYQKWMRSKLALWTTRLDTIETWASPAIKAEHARQLARWRALAEIAQAKLLELEHAPDSDWARVKLALDEVWQFIGPALEPGPSISDHGASATA